MVNNLLSRNDFQNKNTITLWVNTATTFLIGQHISLDFLMQLMRKEVFFNFKI